MQKNNKNFKKLLPIILFVIMMLIANIQRNKEDNTVIDGVEVSFIDIGQGDSILIKTKNNKNILIDTGSNQNSDKLFHYLNKKNIKDFYIVIATHPDEDHIGSMANIIKKYPIENFIMPDRPHNTTTFKKMVSALKNKNVNVINAMSDLNFELSDGAKLYILHPDEKEYLDNNQYSVVAKLVYGNNSFLFTGDIDQNIERKLVKRYGDFLQSDILKLAHHGSSSSSSDLFIKTVNPKAVVLSCSKDNSYGHPHREIVSLMKKLEMPMYRTDEQGDIVFKSNSKEISCNLPSPGSYKRNKPQY